MLQKGNWPIVNTAYNWWKQNLNLCLSDSKICVLTLVLFPLILYHSSPKKVFLVQTEALLLKLSIALDRPWQRDLVTYSPVISWAPSKFQALDLALEHKNEETVSPALSICTVTEGTFKERDICSAGEMCCHRNGTRSQRKDTNSHWYVCEKREVNAGSRERGCLSLIMKHQ